MIKDENIGSEVVFDGKILKAIFYFHNGTFIFADKFVNGPIDFE